MASYIARRKFLAALGGAAAWPLAAEAQQAAMPVIGFLNPHRLKGTRPWQLHSIRARKNPAVEGQNVAIEYRWAEG